VPPTPAAAVVVMKPVEVKNLTPEVTPASDVITAPSRAAQSELKLEPEESPAVPEPAAAVPDKAAGKVRHQDTGIGKEVAKGSILVVGPKFCAVEGLGWVGGLRQLRTGPNVACHPWRGSGGPRRWWTSSARA
jgi:hypothetical protein